MNKHSSHFTPGFGGGKFGSNFFQNAKPSPDIVVSKLSVSTSIALLCPRKTGKTSLLAESRDRLVSMGKNVVCVDLDISDTPTKALSALLGAMNQGKSKGIADGIKDWVENSDYFSADQKTTVGALVSGGLSHSSENLDEGFIEAIYLQIGKLLEELDADSKPIIIFDELTTMVRNTIEQSKPEETRMVVGKLNSFLGMLRSWRKDEIGVRMAVSGSVSFDWLHYEYGVRRDSTNDCVRLYIEELDRDEAKNLLNLCVEANANLSWIKKIKDELIDYLPANYPGLIQLAFAVLSSETVPVEKLNESIREKLDQALWDNYFEQFEARFRRYSPSERRRCTELFSLMEQKEGGKISGHRALETLYGEFQHQDETEGRELISRLRADSFIVIVSGGIRISSGLVPAWRNFGNKVEF